MNILLSCHTSREIGMGHFMRQLHIAGEMISRGHKVTFAVSDYPPALSLLEEKKLLYFKFKKAPFDITPEFKTDIIVLDINDTDKSYIQSLKKNGSRVVSFDDLGTGRDYVDLLIDSNLDPVDFLKTGRLFGPDYVILNNTFLKFRNSEKLIPEKIERVAITMGGTDPKGAGPEIADFFLKSGSDFKIDLILGAGFNDKNNKSGTMDFILDNSSKCTIHKNLPDLAEILFNADIVICAGGMTIYEACAVGTPAIVICEAEHQQKTALKVQDWGAAISLGMWKESVLTKLIPTINSLNITKRKKMSINGKERVDCKGLQRVVENILIF